MKKQFFTILFSVLFYAIIQGQTPVPAPDWSLKVSSNVEKDGRALPGATVILYRGSAVVTQVQSDANGDFQINIPPNGDYIIAISYAGCNTKKFSVSTMGVPPETTKGNIKDEVEISGGVTMSKPLPGINYSLFNQPLLRIMYMANKKVFADDAYYTSQMVASFSDIRQQETDLLAKYAAALKNGDAAFSKKNCELAKTNYATANSLLPDEVIPKEKLLAAEKCVKEKENETNKAAQEKAAAEAAAKAAADKAAADKAAADKAAKEKAAAEKLAKEQEAAKKAEDARLAAEKAAADKAAQEKAAQEKAAAEKLAKEQEAAKKAEEARLAAKSSS